MEIDFKKLARSISIIENEIDGYELLLEQLKHVKNIPIIGITGPPGAGKSTIVNALISQLVNKNKKIAVLAVDPTSPFNLGSILGDRIRMVDFFNNPNVFIRSIATRGSLGGLSSKILEIIDVVKTFDFDYLIIETVGVGQSEIEIAGIADTTVLVLVPEAGDEIQTIKSGIMEIADIFVINKSDRVGADIFVKNIEALLISKNEKQWKPIVIKTIADKHIGINLLIKEIDNHQHTVVTNDNQIELIYQKAISLIAQHKIKQIDKIQLKNEISEKISNTKFNLYTLIKKYF